MERLSNTARRDAYGSKINRDHSPVLAYGIPWISIILASLAPLLPIIALAPIVPPVSYLMLLAWGLSRPGLLPMWAGIPLGFIDDLYSGQPLGSAILLFSLTMIALELFELRFPWRSFWQNWATASVALAIYIVVTALVSGGALTSTQLVLLVPQVLLSIILFPVFASIVAMLDRMRLTRVRKLG